MEPSVVLVDTVLLVTAVAVLVVAHWWFRGKFNKVTVVEQQCQIIINEIRVIRVILLACAVLLGVGISVFVVEYSGHTPENMSDVRFSAFIVVVMCAAMIGFSILLARTRQLLASLEQEAQQAN